MPRNYGGLLSGARQGRQDRMREDDRNRRLATQERQRGLQTHKVKQNAIDTRRGREREDWRFKRARKTAGLEDQTRATRREREAERYGRETQKWEQTQAEREREIKRRKAREQMAREGFGEAFTLALQGAPDEEIMDAINSAAGTRFQVAEVQQTPEGMVLVSGDGKRTQVPWQKVENGANLYQQYALGGKGGLQAPEYETPETSPPDFDDERGNFMLLLEQGGYDLSPLQETTANEKGETVFTPEARQTQGQFEGVVKALIRKNPRATEEQLVQMAADRIGLQKMGGNRLEALKAKREQLMKQAEETRRGGLNPVHLMSLGMNNYPNEGEDLLEQVEELDKQIEELESRGADAGTRTRSKGGLSIDTGSRTPKNLQTAQNEGTVNAADAKKVKQAISKHWPSFDQPTREGVVEVWPYMPDTLKYQFKQALDNGHDASEMVEHLRTQLYN